LYIRIKVEDFMQKIKLGITIGDFNGIGPEVIIKALSDGHILKHCTPIIYGSSKIIAYHKNIVNDANFRFTSIDDITNASSHKINVLNCWHENVNINLGQVTEEGGKYAHIALDRAVHDAKEGHIDALVTAPINKKGMSMSGFQYPGHTEFLQDRFNVKGTLMMMVSADMKLGLVTNHVPLFQLSDYITKDRILRKLNLLEKTLRVDFGIEKPIIAVLGLNPHASDNGAIGDEDEKLVRPIIIEAKKKGNAIVMGPYPADGFFGSRQFTKPDGILAMYHDQGLIPFKALSFGTGVNFTAGLPIVRTSPDHGTAFDLAGNNAADPGSMVSALRLAIDLVHNRQSHKEANANPLGKLSNNPAESMP
jgi:4-hydroxythreonine-4-phosphate dehydrogenase